jgi:KUP system potassium uptake protein
MTAATQISSDSLARCDNRVLSLSVAAVGVVYGDIGTSPLYTMREVFGGAHAVAPLHHNVLGILSLIFWSLIVVVSLKYVVFIMRADNRGEGGIMALTALALRTPRADARQLWWLTLLGMFGAALFYGDGVITPAISVLSAVEGLEVATPVLKPVVVPVTIVVIVALFLVQRRGTASVGALFGPVMCLWFAMLAVLGVRGILHQPAVLTALSPHHALSFALQDPLHAFFSLGAVVLAVTGGEALYADMGHFGRRPIRLAWFYFVLPAIFLNYLGQGALIIENPVAVKNPFYLLVPPWFLYPMVAIATLATIIASQAVISGAFSLTRQAMQLGYAPRMNFMHTSEREIGQIYVPAMNWALLAGVLALVIGFRSSSALASAYGIAVTGTMMIDTILAFIVVRSLWRWSWPRGGLFLALFLAVDLAFFSANLHKVPEGGWFPILLGISVFTLLSTWKSGRTLMGERLKTESIPVRDFIHSLKLDMPHRVPGTSVFLTANPDGVPRSMLQNLFHNKVLHQRVVFLHVISEDVPHVPEIDRAEVRDLGEDFYLVLVRYGFKDEPDIPRALAACAEQGLPFDMMETSFFLSRETLIPKRKSDMSWWREKLFIWMFRNAGSATDFFNIPTNRVVELGAQVVL